MNSLKFLVKEFGTLTAFVMIGSLLLLSFWVSQNVSQNLFQEFKHDKISLIIEEGSQNDFREFAEGNQQILSYTIHSGEENKALLQELYPELKTVIRSLEADFFPLSATLNVVNADEALAYLNELGIEAKEQLVHRSPVELQNFFWATSGIFLFLWVLTTGLVLHFQVERLAFQETRRWSLMKMLGARARDIFWPICFVQIGRLAVASVVAVFLARLGASQFERIFQWGWSDLNWTYWVAFLVLSTTVSSLTLFSLFSLRYRKVQLG